MVRPVREKPPQAAAAMPSAGRFSNGVRVCAVAAIGRNRELGKDNKLLWHIPEDLKRFKELTKGHPVIMGRKTFESILGYLGTPLPERPNIVISRKGATFVYKGRTFANSPGNVLVVSSLEEAIAKAKELDANEIHIGGGAEIYAQALPFTDKLYLTLIDDSKEADSFFPPYEHLFTKKVFEEAHEWRGLAYRYVDLERA